MSKTLTEALKKTKKAYLGRLLRRLARLAGNHAAFVCPHRKDEMDRLKPEHLSFSSRLDFFLA